MSDETRQDLHAAAGGDSEAFTRLFERLHPLLHTWARLRVKGPLSRSIDPEDVIQEVWWRALETLSSFDESKGSFRSWLLGIASNVLREMMRRRSGMRDGGRAPIAETPDSMLDQQKAQLTSITLRARRDEQLQEVIAFAMKLDESDRQLLVHHGIERIPAREIGQMFDLPEETVAKRWQRLRARLASGPLWRMLTEDVS